MTDLLIRKIDPKLKRELEKRARTHNRSLSDEAKIILRRGVAEAPAEGGLGTRLFSMLPDEFRGDDLVFEVPGGLSEPPDFE
jgi:plasmid stability protein